MANNSLVLSSSSWSMGNWLSRSLADLSAPDLPVPETSPVTAGSIDARCCSAAVLNWPGFKFRIPCAFWISSSLASTRACAAFNCTLANEACALSSLEEAIAFAVSNCFCNTCNSLRYWTTNGACVSLAFWTVSRDAPVKRRAGVITGLGPSGPTGSRSPRRRASRNSASRSSFAPLTAMVIAIAITPIAAIRSNDPNSALTGPMAPVALRWRSIICNWVPANVELVTALVRCSAKTAAFIAKNRDVAKPTLAINPISILPPSRVKAVFTSSTFAYTLSKKPVIGLPATVAKNFATFSKRLPNNWNDGMRAVIFACSPANVGFNRSSSWAKAMPPAVFACVLVKNALKPSVIVLMPLVNGTTTEFKNPTATGSKAS